MSCIFGLLVIFFGMFSVSALAQQEGAATVASPIPAGIYRGVVTQKSGAMRSDGRWRTSEFDLNLSRSPGTLAMHRASSPCNSSLPISVTSVKDGVVRLEQGGAFGGIIGCDRVFELTVSGNDLSGIMSNPDGNTYDVKATKK